MIQYGESSCVAAAIALLALTGCATAAPAKPVAGVVFEYTAASEEERAAQEEVLRADDEARAAIKEARLQAERAGVDSFDRGTDEGLSEEAAAAWRAYERLIIGQVDRYELFLRKYPDNWFVRHRYAWFLSDQTMNYEAADEWRRVIRREPRFPFAHNNLGSLYNHMGRDMEAVDLFLKAIELYDQDPVFHLNLAVNYSVHRDPVAEKFGWDLPRVWRECMASYRRALALSPTDVEIARDIATQHVLARFFQVPDTTDQALKDWEYCLSLELTDAQRGAACRAVGGLYLKQKKDYAAAIEWLEKADTHFRGDDPSTTMLLERARKAAADAP